MLLSFVFVVFVSPNVVAISAIDANFLFRVPFMFAISIFYGHLANQVKQEKKRAERVQEAANLKRQLICALAHDIKTPLNVILGHAELLVEPSPPADKRDSFACIRKNVDRISKLITDFLDVSKLESVTFQGAKEWVHMNAIAEEVVAQLRVTAREKNLRLMLELENNLEPILGDEDQMQRLLARYGYGVTPTACLDDATRDAVAAFQRHFRPMRVDGGVDVSTAATLEALLAARDARPNTAHPS